MRYTAEKTWQGYEILDRLTGLYVMSVYRGRYRWVQDYTYARKFSAETAKKHLLRLNEN